MDLADKLNAIKNGEDLPQEDLAATKAPTESQETENLETAPEQHVESQEVEPQALETEDPAQIAESESEKWEPTLKYKVLKDEHDFPEWSKGLVTSKEVEEQFVDLFSKANALEHQKKRRGEIEDEFAKLQSEYDTKMSDAQQLAQIVSDHNQRIASNNPVEQLVALQNAGLNEKAILDIARHVLDLQKMEPSQRQAYDQQFKQKEQLTQYESQLNQTQQSLQAAQQEAARAQLMSFLATKNDFIKEYEGIEGNSEGDFQDDFTTFGIALEQKLGREVEWKEAFKQFKKVHGLGRPKSKPAPKTLPNLKSSGHSPVERSFTNMDDLRKHMNTSRF